MKALQHLETRENLCEDTLNVLNQLGILWSNRGDFVKAESFLKRALEVARQHNIGHGNPLTRYH